MMFPAEMLVDYVRVYQRKGSTNVGCSPKDYPTAEYIDNHLEAYQSMSRYGFIVSHVNFFFRYERHLDVAETEE
jgi:hypothetical protein